MTVRRTTTLITAALAAGLLAAGGATAGTAAPAGSAAAAESRVAPRTTSLTFTVPDCEGCEVQLHQGRSTLDADVVHVWSGKAREVTDGKVTFRVPSRRTRGMSVTVRAPWEGHTGYLTTVAWRYNGMGVGDAITLEEAVSRTRASACWEGTRRRTVTVPLVVAPVEVEGVRERVQGSIAFVPETSAWLPPMRRVWDGVLGSQDVNICDVQR